MTEGLPEAVCRLAVPRGESAPFLQSHHLEAARRLAQLFERARLRQRVTMSYDPTYTGRRAGGGTAQGELSASAADARRTLSEIAAGMPDECWAVLFDVCGLDRGFQDIEVVHDWPRRGGKLVLRIALSHLAARYGLTTEARGQDRLAQRHWLPERVSMFPATEAS